MNTFEEDVISYTSMQHADTLKCDGYFSIDQYRITYCTLFTVMALSSHQQSIYYCSITDSTFHKNREPKVICQ